MIKLWFTDWRPIFRVVKIAVKVTGVVCLAAFILCAVMYCSSNMDSLAREKAAQDLRERRAHNNLWSP